MGKNNSIVKNKCSSHLNPQSLHVRDGKEEGKSASEDNSAEEEMAKQKSLFIKCILLLSKCSGK